MPLNVRAAPSRLALVLAGLGSAIAAPPALAQATTATEILAGYVAKAGAPASPERGQKLFNQTFDRDYPSCTTCHGAQPTRTGKDMTSEKTIEPLAPAASARRFTDAYKVERAFALNCKEVLGRECSVQEKADILGWLLTLKP